MEGAQVCGRGGAGEGRQCLPLIFLMVVSGNSYIVELVISFTQFLGQSFIGV